jgi:hypothetical protein
MEQAACQEIVQVKFATSPRQYCMSGYQNDSVLMSEP